MSEIARTQDQPIGMGGAYAPGELPLWQYREIILHLSFNEILEFIGNLFADPAHMHNLADANHEGDVFAADGDSVAYLDRQVDQNNLWLYFCITIGVIRTKVRYGDNFRKAVSTAFKKLKESSAPNSISLGVSQSEVGRYARIYEEIVFPRMKDQEARRMSLRARDALGEQIGRAPDGCCHLPDKGFPFYHRGYYVAACEFARKLETPALDLLEMAEQEATKGKYTVEDFRQSLRTRRSKMKLREISEPEDIDFTTAWTDPVEVASATNRPDGHYQHSLLDSPLDVPEIEWVLISTVQPTMGIYMAANGRSEAAIGLHRNDVTQARDIILDGKIMAFEEAWDDLVDGCYRDGLLLPRLLIFPEVEDQFEHRPEASGRMEILCVPFVIDGKVIGLLMIDYADKRHLLMRSQQSYGFLHEICKPLVEHMKTKKAEIFTGEETRW